MSTTFITDIHIGKVRHIENFDIPLSKTEMKHLIITGKNGSGKTSVLEHIDTSIAFYLKEAKKNYARLVKFTNLISDEGIDERSTDSKWNKTVEKLSRHTGVVFCGQPEKYDLIHALFAAKRIMPQKTPKGIKQVTAGKRSSHEDVSVDFMQLLANSVFDQLLAEKNKDYSKAKAAARWLDDVEKLILSFTESDQALVTFDDGCYTFKIIEIGKNPYNLSQLPDGFSSIMNIISGIMLRVGISSVRSDQCKGVVLIDEIETHLHVSLQKKILPFLTAFFPNIQFIVTTHSPFVINSVKNAVICDLEKRIVTEDLSGYSYGTLIESYFGSDNYSEELKKDLAEYEALMKSKELSLEEEEKLQDLEIKLNQLPKYWAPELDYKLKQIQLEKADRAPA